MSESSDISSIMEGLKDSFIETATEKLNILDDMIEVLRTDTDSSNDVMTDFRGQVHSLKGIGGTFGFPLISMICHRLEEYIETERTFSADEFDELQMFVDKIRQIIEIGDNPDDKESERTLAELPTPPDPAPTTAPVTEVKIILASPMATLRKMAEFFLSEQGCQVISTDSSVKAFQLAVENRPHLVISSVQMETMSGTDLGRAVAAVSLLKNTRVSLMTSSADAGDLSAGIPDEFSCIRTDHMEDDISEVLNALNIDLITERPGDGAI